MRVVSTKRSGFTLIEVIIAMAIFVIGAVAIVQIFPPALAALQGSQDRSNATRLATSQIERFRLRAGNSTVPDAIYSLNAGGAFDTTFAGAFNGTVNSNQSLPRDVRNVGDTALDRGRYIDGESQRVMKSDNGTVATGDDYFFVLTDFPYVLGSLELSTEDVIEEVRIEFDPTSLPTKKYVFDFSDAKSRSTGLPTSLDVNARYYVSYRWVDNNGRINGVVDEPYVFQSNNANNRKVARDEQFQSNAIQAINEGDVEVRMVKTVNSNNVSPLGDELRGVYAFTGAGGINAGETVKVSYPVSFSGNKDAGWRGLVLDQPSAGGAVTLTTRGLDESVYAFVYSAPNRNGESVGAPQRGECLPPSNGVCGDSTDAIDAVKNAGNQTNRVEFSAAANSLVAPRARVVYQPLDGWGVQVAVAARSYVPFVNFTILSGNGYKSDEPWREYLWKNNEASLYFQPSEAGKSVLVSYEYYEGATGTYQIINNAVVTLNDRTIPTPTTGFGSGVQTSGCPTDPHKCVQASVAAPVDKNGDLFVNKADADPTDSYITAILAVRGASVQARTVWADNQGRYSQTVVTDYRKRS